VSLLPKKPHGAFMKYVLGFLLLLSSSIYSQSLEQQPQVDDKKVFLTILARNKAHLIPYYLKTIENLDYDKKKIAVYINTNDNSDATEELLLDWMKKHTKDYATIIYEKNDYRIDGNKPHDWNSEKLKVLAKIRNKSFRLAKEIGADYYFVVDCDNFIVPSTLKDLMAKDKPIIAPLLVSIPESNDISSNFFYAVDENGYWKNDPEYYSILNCKKQGTFKVPVVHCTYLIKSEFLDKLNYDSGTGEWEFIVLSRNARQNGIDQYICNEKKFGTNIHFKEKISLEEEKQRIKELPLSSFSLTSLD
jgi:Anp1 protein